MKAIYSQNPSVYSKVFPIQNILDFMLKICEMTRDGAFCCEYHKLNFQMLLQPQMVGTMTLEATFKSSDNFENIGDDTQNSVPK